MNNSKQKILIVEDEDSIRNALKDKLTEVGFLVLEAKNGKQGVGVALQKHPDLILLDLLMPVMDGVTMLKHMRTDEWGKNAKVIMLTNLSENERVDASAELGANDFLVKANWKLEEVVIKIKKLLSKK
ncbi:MAG: hypothetical protein A2908_02070 [Candidatus Staskawiczbacteria bacterium RIFCSPLOWO2_01_FULL_38_12b]|uniref:Response regulatory domain-containing protein n=1 Tax=Candidatus Staskawiczbacteria bacterium RIFCSPLOWO2_01_FULL_38_12b TaxID=1802214 RepID=A0A1G2IG82_9BACT|nr:MAG: hypothetical protein A2908_02070 [Candidatus Staskawiczbacteria bacterium RIFCSPLOWO2_01_FULL_38_12b]